MKRLAEAVRDLLYYRNAIEKDDTDEEPLSYHSRDEAEESMKRAWERVEHELALWDEGNHD